MKSLAFLGTLEHHLGEPMTERAQWMKRAEKKEPDSKVRKPVFCLSRNPEA